MKDFFTAFLCVVAAAAFGFGCGVCHCQPPRQPVKDTSPPVTQPQPEDLWRSYRVEYVQPN